jgi:hypothetical protein
MTRVVRHDLPDVDLVRATLDQAYREHAERLAAYSPKLTWSDAGVATVTVTVMAKTIRATFTVDAKDVHVDSKFPFVFSYLEGKVLTKLCDRLDEAFAKARADLS